MVPLETSLSTLHCNTLYPDLIFTPRMLQISTSTPIVRRVRSWPPAICTINGPAFVSRILQHEDDVSSIESVNGSVTSSENEDLSTPSRDPANWSSVEDGRSIHTAEYEKQSFRQRMTEQWNIFIKKSQDSTVVKSIKTLQNCNKENSDKRKNKKTKITNTPHEMSYSYSEDEDEGELIAPPP